MASFTAAGTAYATWGQPMIPFFIFYSMFGFQRVGDLIWSFGDQRGRGFLLGATAGRTTLTGEGLQHCDGQSQLLASAVPELPRVRPRVRVRDGRDRPRRHRAHVRRRARGLLLLPHALQRELLDAGDARGRRGRHRARPVPLPRRARADGHRTRRRSSRAAPRCSPRSRRSRCSPRTTTSPPTCGARRATSCCARTRSSAERWNRLHPTEPPRTPYVTELLRDTEGPDRRGDRLHEGGARPDRPLRAAAVRRRSAPTATASPTRGPRCAATSRSTRRTSWSRCSTGSRRPSAIKAEVVHEAIARYEIDPDTLDPRLT